MLLKVIMSDVKNELVLLLAKRLKWRHVFGC